MKPSTKIKSEPTSETTVENPKIAIIGMDFHFPQSPDKESFWELLSQKKTAFSEVPKSRWDWEEYWGDPNKEVNKTKVKWGGFIDDIDKFDAAFFKMSPREAIFMEPQQRLLLQSCWRAFEDAGYNHESFVGTSTGVFVGAGAALYSYLDLLTKHSGVDAYTATGNCFSVLANRLSWFFDLRGPSESVDTACASSFTAMNRAIKSIWRGECGAAVVSAASIHEHPFGFVVFDQPGMLSRTGEIKPFDETANGYVRGEGYGTLIIKKLSAALEDGDYVYGVIRGMEVNHTGRVSSMTVPGPKTQAELISSVCAKTNTSPGTINYVEAHGTGTPVGDPLEIKGLKKAWEMMKEHFDLPEFSGQYCSLGTVKANIGHLEPASGFAGLIKTLLALQHKQIPAHPTLTKLSPGCKLDDSPFSINTELKEWRSVFDREGRALPRRAIVSSYGFGGTNATLLLEERQNQPDPIHSLKEDFLFVFSARGPAQLVEMAKNFIDYLQKNEVDNRLGSIAYTLQTGRKGMAARLAVIANNRTSLTNKLSQFLRGDLNDGIFSNTDVNRKQAPYLDSDSLTALLNEQSGAEFLTTGLIKEKRWKKLAALWSQGLDIQWNKGYLKGERKRIPLPAYPFEKKSYWYKTLDKAKIKDVNPETVQEKSLYFDEIASSGTGQLFVKTLSGREFYLQDHRLKNEPILPAAMQLELIRLALREGGRPDVNIIIRNAVWMKPLIVKSPITIKVFISKGDGLSSDFRIFSATENGEEEIYSKGKIGFQAELSPEKQDMFVLSRQCPHPKDVRELYEEFQQNQSLFYGPSFQVIDSLKSGSGESLALLKHKGSTMELKQHALHPSLLDGAFQSIKGIMEGDQDPRVFLPFSVDKLHVFAPLEGVCQAYAQKTEEHKDSRAFSIDIMSESGKVLAYVENFRVMAMPEKAKTSEEAFHLYKSVWRDKPIESDLKPEREALLFFGDNERLANSLGFREVYMATQGKAYEFSGKRAVLNPLEQKDFERLFQDLSKNGKRVSHIIYQWDERGMADLSLKNGVEKMSSINARLLWLAKSVVPEALKHPVSLVSLSSLQLGETDLLYETMPGFWRSIVMEAPKMKYKSLAVTGASPDETTRLLKQELNNSDMEVKYDDGQRSVKELWSVPIRSMEDSPRRVTLKNQGVYLITGGLGGVGLELAGYIMKKYQAKVVLTDIVTLADKHREKLKNLALKGGEVEYIKGSMLSPEHVANIIRLIETKYQKCDGIFHCAGMTRDSGCLKKTLQDMNDVGAPKTTGSLAVKRIADSCGASFVLCFSSFASVLGNAGQADYAFANRFMASYGAFVNGGKSDAKWFAMQWSLWKNGGMAMPKETLRYLKRIGGFVPIRSEVAFASMEYCFNHGITQVAVLEGDQAQINRYLGTPENIDPLSVSGRKEKITAILSEILNIAADELDPEADLSEYGVDLIQMNELSDKIDEAFFVKLDDDFLSQYPSINTLMRQVAFLSGESGPALERPASQASAEQVAPSLAKRAQSAVVGTPGDSVSIQDAILKVCSNELKIDAAELDPEEDFSEYGADSIMLTKIATQIEEAYSIELNPSALINHTTIKQLADYLIEEFGLDSASEEDAQVASAEPQTEISTQAPATFRPSSSGSIQDAILKVCSNELKIDAAELDPEEDFSEYGADSIMLTKIATQIEEAYSIELNPSALINHTTIKQLADYLIEEFGLESPPEEEVQVAPTEPQTERAPQAPATFRASSSGSIQDAILKVCSNELKIDAAELDPEEDFSEYGADSIMLTKIATQIEEAYSIELNPSALINHTTIKQLADYLIEEFGLEETVSPAQEPAPISSPAREPEAVRAPTYQKSGEGKLFKGSFLDKKVASLNTRYRLLEKLNYDFFERRVDEYDGAWVVTGGRRMLMLASYSYMGLIGHPKVNAAAKAAVDAFGTGTHGVRVLAGTTSTHFELEQTIARFKKTEAAMAYSSGYVANLSTISTLVGSGDAVICDAYDHASIVDGCKLSSAEFAYFNHNDMNSLENRLKKAGNKGKLVIVDGVYSMDGDISNMPPIVELCKKYKAALMVDEAHSIGCVGKTGRGVEEHFNLAPDDIDIKMGTLSKTIPGAGGYIAGKKELIDAVKANANSFIFSAALPGPIAAAAKAAFEVMEEEPERVEKLHRNVERYVGGIKKLGFDTLHTQSAVVPVICKTEEKTFEMVRICQEAGLFVLPVVYPAVPVDLPRLRTTVLTSHSFDDIDFALEILEKAGKETGVI